MTNIQLFDDITTRIFALLYEHFPIEKDIDCLKLTDCQEVDEYGSACHETDVCVATLKWLAESDFIRIRKIQAYGASGVVLTARGLETLKQIPDSVNSRTTVGEQLTRMIKAGAKESAVEIIRLALSEAAKRF